MRAKRARRAIDQMAFDTTSNDRKSLIEASCAAPPRNARRANYLPRPPLIAGTCNVASACQSARKPRFCRSLPVGIGRLQPCKVACPVTVAKGGKLPRGSPALEQLMPGRASAMEHALHRATYARAIQI